MSVILFSRSEVYKEMADSYEGLKACLTRAGYSCSENYDYQFYNSLRRLYFANVATFLCQYHAHTPEDIKNISIDTFADFPKGTPNDHSTILERADVFLQAWSSLQYNLITNDGEQFIPKQAQEFIQNYAERLARCVIEAEATLQQKA
jgi:hypothetical protein